MIDGRGRSARFARSDEGRGFAFSSLIPRLSSLGSHMAPELLHRLLEADSIFFTDKADHVAAGVAPKAVVKVGLGVDGKGRGLFLVEGTEAHVVAPLLLELHAVGLDDRFEVMGFLDRLDLLFRYFHEKAPFPETLSRGKLKIW